MIARASATIGFLLNGTRVEVAGPGGRRLLDVLRDDLGLIGTKEGCGEGECGTCTVLLDGQVVDSCLVPACQVEGRAVTTVEGLADGGRLDPLQAALLEAGGVQCGFCSPGILLAGHAFLRSGAAPTDEAIREAIAGNLCRCTGYTRIVEGIRLAALAPSAAGDGPAPGAAQATRTTGDWPAHAAAAIVAPPRSRGPARPTARDAPVASPRTLGEALRILADSRPRPIAGGTDVMVDLAARGAIAAEPLLDLSGIDELRGIRLEGDVLEVGALTTYMELRRSPLVQERLPALGEVAAAVGAAQVQNRGTIGGNIANASPAGDTLPLLLATDASIVAGSVRGARVIPAGGFFTGYRRTALEPDELVLRVRFPLPAGRQIRFRKIGTRRAQAISKVVLAVSWRGDGGSWRDVRVALGSVAERPIRAQRTEAALEGTRPGPETADLAAATVAAEITPIDDVRSTAAYRRAVTGRVLRRIVLEAGAG
jgi:xanthine dehydrogenase small subunit